MSVTSALRLLRRGGRRKDIVRHASFSAASRACDTHGYSDSDIVDVVVSKTRHYRDQLLETQKPFPLNSQVSLHLCSLLMSRREWQIRVLDFGGAAGTHYFNLRSLLPNSISLRWVVVETEGMVQQAAKYLESEELRFVTSIEQGVSSLDRVDLAMSSGAVQYLEDPIAYVSKLAGCGADYLSLDRSCLTKGSVNVYVTHKTNIAAHGPGRAPQNVANKVVSVPSVIVPHAEFLRAVEDRYSIIAMQSDESGILQVPGEEIVGLGLIGKKRDPELGEKS